MGTIPIPGGSEPLEPTESTQSAVHEAGTRPVEEPGPAVVLEEPITEDLNELPRLPEDSHELRDLEPFLSFLREARLEQYGPILEIVAERIFKHRLENEGYIPGNLHRDSVGVGGVYPAVEIVVRLVDEQGVFQGYLLKMRETHDQGWQGEWHIPGTGGRMTDGSDEPFARLAGELFGKRDASLVAGAQPVGVEIHTEYRERKASCWTFVHTIDVRNPSELDGEWQLYTPRQLDDPAIVDHHRNTLRWINDPSRPFLADLR